MRKRMDASHFKQLLLYVPDKDEADKLRAFRGDTTTLNEADHLFLKVTVIIWNLWEVSVADTVMSEKMEF